MKIMDLSLKDKAYYWEDFSSDVDMCLLSTFLVDILGVDFDYLREFLDNPQLLIIGGDEPEIRKLGDKISIGLQPCFENDAEFVITRKQFEDLIIQWEIVYSRKPKRVIVTFDNNKFMFFADDQITKEIRALLSEAKGKEPILRHYPIGHFYWEPVLDGFHYNSEKEKVRKIVKEEKGPFSDGTYQAKWKYKNLFRVSSFFPDVWNEDELTMKISEAMENIIWTENLNVGTWFFGKTEDGMLIRILLKNGESDYVITVFPVLNYRREL